MDALLAYLPQDRRAALAAGAELPDRCTGAALFADISGFTPLTEALTAALGPRQGIEALTDQINAVYDALIAAVDAYGGSVIGFAGDAITCWFDATAGPAAPRAVACARAQQAAMQAFAALPHPAGDPTPLTLRLKVAIATGPARRFLVGDPAVQILNTLAGATLDRLTAGQGDFLTELRPAVALFLRFGGIDYDADPDAHTKLDAYIRWVQQRAARYGGTLLQLTLGDKGSYLYLVWGVPIAHEDDAARAAHTALALRQPPPALAFVGPGQLGLTSGVMRTGASGSATRRTYAVLGDAVNLAARLMQAAAPGQVLASAPLVAATAAAFAWETLPPRRVKGKAAPVAVAALHGAPTAAAGLPEPRPGGALVGRVDELAQLTTWLAHARTGQGQVVGLVGEPGIGKSRLVQALAAEAAAAGWGVYSGAALATETRTAYRAWWSIVQGLLGGLAGQRGAWAVAGAHYEAALEIYRELGARARELALWSNLGLLAYQRGEYDAAARYEREALAMAEALGNQDAALQSRSSLGGVLVGQGVYEEAAALLREVIAEVEGVGGRGFVAEAYIWLAEALVGQGWAGEAHGWGERARAQAAGEGRREFEAGAWRVLGQVAAAGAPVVVGGQEWEASACFAVSAQIYTAIEQPGEAARTAREWARHELGQGAQAAGAARWAGARAAFVALDMPAEVARMDADPHRPARGAVGADR